MSKKVVLPQTICERLLHAESEDEVIHVLKDAGYWDDRTVWKAYGDISNNRGVVGNQQSSPVAALVEKLVNSIDAVLMSECWRTGIDPTSGAAPKSMTVAVAQFFGVTNGKIENVDATRRKELAEKIRLVATGAKDQPCYLIIDDGEGQRPEAFPATFLSLLRENKARVPFVQGKYNMGGTGVLQFAGRNSFQLIVSRRQNHISNEDTPWGFTIIRRLDPTPEQPFTAYVYLAPNDRILSFNADHINVLPGRYPEPYSESLEAGTCIKLWSYKLPGRLKTLATLDLRYALERYLPDPALPIRVYERRVGYRANYYDTTMPGLFAVLSDSADKIEPGFDTGSVLDVEGVGRVILRLVVLKEELADDKRYPAGVFFHVNGQLHSELSSDYMTRRAKLDYISDSLIVTVDCTDLPQRTREDLFLASRDRMRHIEERFALEDAIAEYLQEHPGLRELNARRREERIRSSTEKEAVDLIQDLIRTDPTLAALFGTGTQIKVPSGPLPEPIPYEGKKFPTLFRIVKEPAEGLVKRCPKNRSCRVTFETDAANDYFSRSIDPGHFTAQGIATIASVHLWNGRATARFSIPGSANVGDRLRVVTRVSDISRPEAFESAFVIEVDPEMELPEAGEPSERKISGVTGLPHIEEVFQGQWHRYKFDERSGLVLRQSDDGSYDVFINMDNLYLRNEIARRRKTDPTLLRFWFKYGLTLLALGMLYDQRRTRTNNAQDARQMVEDFNRIAEATRGLAVTIIPVMMQLTKERGSRTQSAVLV